MVSVCVRGGRNRPMNDSLCEEIFEFRKSQNPSWTLTFTSIEPLTTTNLKQTSINYHRYYWKDFSVSLSSGVHQA